MKNKFFLGLSLLGILVSTSAFAWDDVGHMQVADICWSRLDAKAKTEIGLILSAGEPKFRPVSLSEKDVRDAFRKASTFADFIKFSTSESYAEIIPKMNLLFQPATDPNDKESFLCKTWHYYDNPIRFMGATPAIKESNALKALAKATSELTKLEKAKKKDRMMQCWWLYWIDHVVGDLHQPLHCVSSFEFETVNGDAGGNKFNIFAGTPTPKTTRLHGYWDTAIGRAIGADRVAGLSPSVEDVTSRWSADPAVAPKEADSLDLKVEDWVRSGAILADTVVYKDIAKNAAPSGAYISAQLALSKKQVVLAGFRMANLLNIAIGNGKVKQPKLPGIRVKTASGLEYEEVKVGTGETPERGETVVVHYVGTLTNGAKFDSSRDRSAPFEFQLGLGQVIKGWDEGLSTMKVGGLRKLFIPANLAYGNHSPDISIIPQNSPLVFEVELLAIKQ